MVDAAAHLADGQTDTESDRDPADRADGEPQARIPEREPAADRGCDRRPVEDERRGVVDEPLALDHDDDPARDAQPPGDRRRRQRIRRRDDGAEDERLLPGEAGHDGVRDERDAAHGREHEPDGEHPDRGRIRTELAQRGVEGGGVEQRRQERHEDEVGRQLDVRHARKQPDDEPAEDEQDRVRHAQDGHEHEQCTRGGQQDEQLQLLVVCELDAATLANGGASRLGAA